MSKEIKQKLDALQHAGTLPMLVDFINVWKGLNGGDSDFVTELIAKVTAHLKVQYMNEITPTPIEERVPVETDFMETSDWVDKLSAIGKVVKQKTKKNGTK